MKTQLNIIIILLSLILIVNVYPRITKYIKNKNNKKIQQERIQEWDNYITSLKNKKSPQYSFTDEEMKKLPDALKDRKMKINELNELKKKYNLN